MERILTPKNYVMSYTTKWIPLLLIVFKKKIQMKEMKRLIDGEDMIQFFLL